MENSRPNTPEEIKRIKIELENKLAQLNKVKEQRMESLVDSNLFKKNGLLNVPNQENNDHLIFNDKSNIKNDLPNNIDKIPLVKKRKKFNINYVVYGVSLLLLSFVIYQYFDFTKTKSELEQKKIDEIIKELTHKNYLDSLDLVNANIKFLEVKDQITKDSIATLTIEQDLEDNLNKEQITTKKTPKRKVVKRWVRRKNPSYSKYKKSIAYSNTKIEKMQTTSSNFTTNTNQSESTKKTIAKNELIDTEKDLIATEKKLINKIETKKTVVVEDQPLFTVQKFPIFPGCENKKTEAARKKCFNSKIKRCALKRFNKKIAKRNKVKRLNVSFIINKYGTIDILDIKGSNSELVKKEAARVIRSLPKFIPGKNDGNVVSVKYNLPINLQ